ncbi:DUF488 domain-containing protein [Glaciihabitans arcticus]|uniref:DUF488 domain-containing protein n=1 Tax=Glaciihabitans arcticus TaxID=2668039 RepID=A0A4Q9GMZ2_9MICO|nr:DUF488 domain-containing protein [Glaciihabitans arcticus]TBN56005.1 DUF488 domain-containing protein [Glaciihabitans arcticus]
MWDESAGIIGIGYEGASVEDLTSQLIGWGVTVLVDVRLNAISRKPGFSKKRLSELMVANNISYLHLPQLGNPRDNRAGYAETSTPEGEQARARFSQLLGTPDAVAAVNMLASLARTTHVAVLCFEKSELACHRHEVLAEVRRALDD